MPSFEGFADRVVSGSLGPGEFGAAEDRTPALGAVAAGDAREGDGDVAGVASGTHTSSIAVGGGFGWDAPESPDPQTHPSRAPSPTRAEAAPLEDQVHTPRPSPCQYPQYCG
jgi:hypothetical protein